MAPSSDPSSPLSLSPDGQHVVFQIRRADPDTNDICVGLVEVDLSGRDPARLLDDNGELDRITFSLRGLEGFQSGLPAAVAPRWSSDGRQIAYLKRLQGKLALWVVNATGQAAPRVVTRENDRISAFDWSPEGQELIYSVESGLAEARAEIVAEARSGYHFDARFAPLSSRSPYPVRPEAALAHGIAAPGVRDMAARYRTVQVSTAMSRDASNGEIARFTHYDSAQPPSSVLFARGPGGAAAWTAPQNPTFFLSDQSLRAKLPGRREVQCRAEACRANITGLWWGRNGAEVVFSRREGWGLSQIGVYRWEVGRGAPRRLMVTDDALIGCISAKQDLLCLQEGSSLPRRLALLSLSDGQITPLFEPNPEFDDVQLGKVERLHWKNSLGIESYGDLVLPPDHKPGTRLPLVVVQYETRGFLRGGTGDEYPIQLLASHGLAVLSFQRPRDFALTASTSSIAEFERLNLQGWNDRRSVMSSLTSVLDMLAERGIIDPRLVALTGLSDGASTVQYALVNSNRFSAVILSSCCQDPGKARLLGDLSANYLQSTGYPSTIERGGSFWSAFSIALNAARIHTPVLMQLADDEYLGALDSYYALKAAGTAVDMYVYPDEHHVKWQPSHRCVIYLRNLAWLEQYIAGKPALDLARITECD